MTGSIWFNDEQVDSMEGRKSPNESVCSTLTSYYYGCKGQAGHYLWHPAGTRAHRDHNAVPFNWRSLDGGLLPDDEQREGQATLAIIQGWTVLSFWDRSVDTRPGSVSCFVMKGCYAFDKAVARARECFPWVFRRFEFEIEQYPTG